MNAKHMEYFLVLCGEGCYSKAAEKLYISPQGLNKAIHKMEEELGVVLLERQGETLTPTEYGEVLLKRSRKYLLEHTRILNEINDLKQHADTSLSIGIKNGFSDALGENYLLDFITANPDLRVNIHSFPMPLVAEAMKDHRRQVWITPGKYDANLFEPLFVRRQKMFLIVGTCHPLARYDRISVQQITEYPVIALPHDIGQKATTETLMKEQVIDKPSYYLDISDRELSMGLVRTGKAISFNSGIAYKKYPDIKRLDFTDLDVTVIASVLLRKDAFMNTAIERFRMYVEQRSATEGLAP